MHYAVWSLDQSEKSRHTKFRLLISNIWPIYSLVCL